MKRRKLKPAVKTTAILGGVLFSLLIIATMFFGNTGSSEGLYEFTYVNDYIFDSYMPVVNQEEKLVKPYTSDKVTLYRGFYEYDSEDEVQKNSIVYYDGIYMQNSGVDYSSEETFDIVSAIGGTVTNVFDDELLGKTIEVRNSTELITIYQCLGESLVKKGDILIQGQLIGKSGTCSLNGKITNGLHFEIYKNGQVINAEKNYNKSLKELLSN